MTKLKIYQIDAFTDKLFGGNPAAVCPLEKWLPDEVLQNIAAENNLAETAYYIKNNDVYEIRWFTPITEVDLCGHATLASAYVIFKYDNFEGDEIIFDSKSGELSVKKENEILTLNFPSDTLVKVDIPAQVIDGLGLMPTEAYKGRMNYLVLFNSEEEIKVLKPDFRILSTIDSVGIIATARGNHVDFVSRFFAPQSGIDEDPVTGSAHTSLTPFWARKLNKTKLTAIQLSKRGGHLICELKGERTLISGQAVIYLKGEIYY